jgi:hypothetical protein
VNAGGTFAVVSDYHDTLVSVDLSSERVSCRFPDYAAAPISCFGVHPRSDNVVIVYADNRFVECRCAVAFESPFRLEKFFGHFFVCVQCLFSYPFFNTQTVHTY